MKRFLKTTGWVMLFLGVGLALGAGIGYLNHMRVRDTMQARLDAAKDRQQWLKKDYKKQKDLVAEARRHQMTLMSKKRALAREKTQLEEELAAVETENKDLAEQVRKVEEILVGLEERRDEHRVRLAELQAEVEALKQQHEDAVAGHKARKEQLVSTKAALENLLDENIRIFDRAYARNQWLCRIGGKLLDEYDKKGVTDALLAQKPLKKAEKAEFAAIKKDYAERIRELQQEQLSRRDEADSIVYK
ncbi:MAG: hypothetical protein SWH68_02995 [Thermodesulfobacteriota bacterium]|nr:hypothetical protein [Thermodesulfobacteriota bacterium]